MIFLKRKKKLSSYSSFPEAIKQIGKKRCLLIIDVPCNISTDVTVPLNIEVKSLLGYPLNVIGSRSPKFKIKFG